MIINNINIFDRQEFNIFFRQAACYLLMVVFYVVLSTGTVLPFDVGGLSFPIFSALYMIVMVILFMLRNMSSLIYVIALFVWPICVVLVIFMLRAIDPGYALKKIDGGVFSTILACGLFFGVMQSQGRERSIKIFLNCALLFLIATIAYKLQYGILDRGVRFFLNGPIVFGWISGFAALLCIYLYSTGLGGKKYLLLFCIFFFSVLWTQSKGPLVSLLFVVAVVFVRNFSLRLLITFLTGLAAVLFASLLILPDDFLYRLTALLRVAGGNLQSSDSGSVGIRTEMILISLEMLREHFWVGVGLGNWGHYSGMDFSYPHNIFAEMVAELGMLGGGAILLVLLLLFLKSCFLARCVLLYFLMCSSFSGDISYLRFALSLPIALVAFEKRSQVLGSNYV